MERRVGANARGRKEKDGFIHRTRRQEFEADNVLTSDFVQQFEARLFRLRRNGMSTFWGPSQTDTPHYSETCISAQRVGKKEVARTMDSIAKYIRRGK